MKIVRCGAVKCTIRQFCLLHMLHFPARMAIGLVDVIAELGHMSRRLEGKAGILFFRRILADGPTGWGSAGK